MMSTTKTGIELIAQERAEQVSKHGWTAEHDDGHCYGEIVLQAAALGCDGTDYSVRETNFPERELPDSWGLRMKYMGDRVHALKVMGALVAAELDRELRLQHQKQVAP